MAATGTVERAVPPADDDTPRTRRPATALLGRTLLAAGGGLALFFAFPGFDLSWLALVGPATLSLAVRGTRFRTGLWLGLVHGLAFFVPLLSWTGVYVGSFPWLALATAESLYVAVLGGALAVTAGVRGWPLWAAALWVGQEAVRGRWPFGGFPWGRLAFSQAEGPFTGLAAYGGTALVSFAVALTGTLLAAAVLALLRARRTDALRAPAVRAGAAAVVAALAVPVLGWVAALPLPGASLTEGGPTRVVAVVQGNVPRAGLDFNAQRRAVLDNHVQETQALALQVDTGEVAQPDLVVWPENSSDIDPYRNADAAAAISTAARAIGAPILVGAVVSGPGEFLSNTAIVWDPETGPGDTYVKRHPVPFAEYIPHRDFFRFFSSQVDLVRNDFAAGEGVGTLDVGGARIGDVICFEVAYDGLVRDVVDAGATMLVVQTNNATFGYTDESPQQLAMGRLRAVEFGRSVVMASTSGISAVIAPDGTLVRSSGLFTAATFVEEIAQRDGRTLASRVGAGPEWVLTALGVAALAGAVGSGVIRRRALRRTPA
ncbi:apolipoprotein N-acyltransferase [Modestobacter sp. Leaf380]|uniref:apolipoprotein N-acyltransferase n=1 Tax=Modestobacter sp. Leaf380 TaxID=1736356 RepID=UPI000B0E7B1F|nr:apolipoprotein N-acyltransferase [Modestobacter sp. Leaf380]